MFHFLPLVEECRLILDAERFLRIFVEDIVGLRLVVIDIRRIFFVCCFFILFIFGHVGYVSILDGWDVRLCAFILLLILIFWIIDRDLFCVLSNRIIRFWGRSWWQIYFLQISAPFSVNISIRASSRIFITCPYSKIERVTFLDINSRLFYFFNPEIIWRSSLNLASNFVSILTIPMRHQQIESSFW